ncbi:hypothetical protein PtA15_6A123 [Puccinia triticina]|uniref:Uncharacterized protein n=1 Tax=Puccinia triticina TaxID=208348 RepID=A0ABY7CK81_9BASI|nr:uncharacterized protein PtA15_6A123 [Puccinia triticina]WAQ85495.1 hypothetical protein PtA15_6A123 [Puccinia triticina]
MLRPLKANRQARKENQEYSASSSRPQKKYRRSNHTITPTDPVISLIFNNQPTTTAARPQEHLQVTELETQVKIDKLILAYKNILDATTNNQQLDKLSKICAHIISQFVECAIKLDSGSLVDSKQPPKGTPPRLSSSRETRKKLTTHSPRYALAQHALPIILRAFPLNQKPHPKRPGLSHPQKIIQVLHGLQRTYSCPAIQAKALLILPTRNWSKI